MKPTHGCGGGGGKELVVGKGMRRSEMETWEVEVEVEAVCGSGENSDMEGSVRSGKGKERAWVE